MRALSRLTMLLVVLILSVSMATAQSESTCFAVYRSAMLAMNAECAGAGAGTLCYGNGNLDAELTENGGVQPFSLAGHTLDLMDVATLRAEPMNIAEGEYGVALARLSVGEDAIAPLLIFGDVNMTNLGADVNTVEVQVNQRAGLFVRGSPDTSADVIETLSFEAVIAATGRSADGLWLQVIAPNGEVGWVVESLVAPLGTLTTLDIVQRTPETIYRPLRGLTLQTGMVDAPCASAAESGLLTQTPEETTLTLTINGIDMIITGTAFIQANDTETVTVNVIEGTAILDNATLRETITAGNRADMGAEITVTPYNYTSIEPLPLELLPRSVIIALDNWESVLIAAQRDPLRGLTNESTCTITTPESINVRVGPGVEYPQRGSMLANQSANPTGRGIGTDGRVWWQLTPGAWVSTDITFAGGDCTVVPLIEVLPRLR